MSPKRYCVELTERERQYLQKIVRSGKDKARKITRARILLLADVSKGKTDEEISDALGICLSTVFNARRCYFQGGVEHAINEDPRLGQPPKFNEETSAKITALACSTPPEGHARWNLRLLADRIVELGIAKSISHQSVRNILKKTNPSLAYLKRVSFVLVVGIIFHLAPAAIAGESDVITPAAEDADASDDILTITTYTGHPEGHLIAFPDGTTMSIDCATGDITTKSHFHVDHCAACSSGNFGKYNRNNVAPGDVIYSDDDRDITVKVVAANGVVIGQAPTEPYPCDTNYENVWSMTLLVKYRGFDYLTGGDMNTGVERALGAALKERDIHVDVFKVSHHGSNTSSERGFLLNISPEYAVIAGGGSEPTEGTLWKLVYAGVKTIYYAYSYPEYEGYPICVATGDAVVTTTDGYTYSISGGSCGDGPVDVDETPTPTPTATPTETPTPTETSTPTNTPTMSPTSTPSAAPPTATPTAIPSLMVMPGALIAGRDFSVSLALTEDIAQPFDFYYFVDTPAGPYTLCLDGRVKRGIMPLYRNVSRFNAPYSKMVRPAVMIPAGMSGKTVTFCAMVMQPGKIPLMNMLTGLDRETSGVIMRDEASATINP